MASDPSTGEQWNSRSVGTRRQHRFFYLLIRLGGRRSAYAFARVVSMWYVLFSPRARRRCRPYLQRRFPQRTGRLQRLIDSYRRIARLSEMLIDRAAFGLLKNPGIKVLFPDGARINDLIDEGDGLIILNTHVGCWQLAMSAVNFLHTPVNLVMYRDGADVDLHYFEHADESAPFAIIDPAGYLGGALEMAGALQRREVVGLTGDRLMGNPSNAIDVTFLGETMAAPIAAYRLAAINGAPIVVLFSHKRNRNEYVIEIADVIRIKPISGPKTADLQPHAQRFADALTRYTQEHPWCFFNFHDMWDRRVALDKQPRRQE